MKPASAPALEQKIRQLRADIDALIDARAKAVARESPGVPIGVIRNMLTARAPACVRIPLDVAQHSEMISPTIPI